MVWEQWMFSIDHKDIIRNQLEPLLGYSKLTKEQFCSKSTCFTFRPRMSAWCLRNLWLTAASCSETYLLLDSAAGTQRKNEVGKKNTLPHYWRKVSGWVECQHTDKFINKVYRLLLWKCLFVLTVVKITVCLGIIFYMKYITYSLKAYHNYAKFCVNGILEWSSVDSDMEKYRSKGIKL